MRLFRYTLTTGTHYPFGDVDYCKSKDIIHVDNDELSEEQIKELLLEKLNLSTEYKEEMGHEWVAEIKLKPILK